MPTVERLGVQDFEACMDLMNLVFSQAHRPHDFEKLLPKLYQKTPAHMACHYGIREDGKLMATIGAYPAQVHLAGRTLSMIGIGGVTTHPRSGGKGYMRLLMQEIERDMQAQGVQLSGLSGERLRYNRYGYEVGGMHLAFTLTAKQFRGLPGPDAAGVTLRRLTPNDAKDLAWARELYEQQPVWVERSNFYDTLVSWQDVPFLAQSPQGERLGYLVATQDWSAIREMCGADDTGRERMLREATAQWGETTLVQPDWDRPFNRRLGALADAISLAPSYQWQILDYQGVVEALLCLQAQTKPLQDGQVRLGIQDEGVLTLQVEQGVPHCAWQPAATAPLTVDRHTALRLLTGPLAPDAVVDLPEEARVLQQWCPLPLALASPDHV